MDQPDIRKPDGDGEKLPIEQFLSDRTLIDDENKTLLVAEDNLVNQKIAVLVLEKLGLKAQIVNNGLEAVEAVRMRDFPVILMDCHMPEMDGFEATKTIRKMEAASERYTPIIAVTAIAMVGDRERCIAAGMDDYISKPIDIEKLKNKLNLWMRREFTFHNQQLAARYFEADLKASTHFQPDPPDPIDIAELEVFYGDSNEVEEVLRLFALTTHSLLAEMQAAIEAGNVAAVARMAHELKGASASVGAKEMSILCLQMEHELGQQTLERAAQTFRAVRRCFASVQVFIERTFQKSSYSPAQDARQTQS